MQVELIQTNCYQGKIEQEHLLIFWKSFRKIEYIKNHSGNFFYKRAEKMFSKITKSFFELESISNELLCSRISFT